MKTKLENKVYYLVPEDPGARSLEPGKGDAARGQQDEGVANCVGPGLQRLHGVHDATGAQVPVKQETETAGVGSIEPAILVRVNTRVLNNIKTMMINNMQTY